MSETARTFGIVAAVGFLLAAATSPARGAEPAPGRAGVGPGPAASDDSTALRLMVFTFRHQRAGEAFATVRALLSPRGSVALDESANTLSVRDSPATLMRVAAVVRAIDHVRRDLAIEVQLIRAEQAMISPALPSVGIDAALLERLKLVFRYDAFELVARSRIDTREGESVAYDMGDGFRLNFTPGTVQESGRLILAGFRMVRSQSGGESELVSTAIHLRRDQPLILGLTSHEGARRALLLALRYAAADPAAPAPVAPPSR